MVVIVLAIVIAIKNLKQLTIKIIIIEKLATDINKITITITIKQWK